MDKMQVQAAIAALYSSDQAESARANTFLMEFTEQPVNICVKCSLCLRKLSFYPSTSFVSVRTAAAWAPRKISHRL